MYSINLYYILHQARYDITIFIIHLKYYKIYIEQDILHILGIKQEN